MLNTARAFGGMTTAPHHLASQAGIAVLREGGNALEAMLAMAAAIAVVYPHMNGLGGDGFWLAAEPGELPVGIQACGPAAKQASPAYYAERGHSASIPTRGPLAALTVAGTVGGWEEARLLARLWGGRIPLADLLGDAIRLAGQGIAVSAGQQRLTREKLPELAAVPGFADAFLIDGRLPAEGERLRQPALAETLEHLGRAGLMDFYRGETARALAADLAAAGTPIDLSDLESFRAKRVKPLPVRAVGATIHNMPPPTQGVASLMILGILDRLGPPADDLEFLHSVVEATKQAFIVRNARIWDPAWMEGSAEALLDASSLDRMTKAIDPRRAAPWPHPGGDGDTIWMGAIDGDGRAVSFIQSLYWEFGSGVVSPRTGIVWQNRGVSFALAEGHGNRLAPGRLPFHTLNPALARFDDGRTMVYGTMGGEGQPQTQAALFGRFAWQGKPLQEAVSAPRWLLGRTWGSESTNLKLESRFDAALVAKLRDLGHDVELVEPFSDLMGHAGAIVASPGGLLEGAADPRSDGTVAAL